MEALGINGPFLLAQIINFLVILWLLRLLVYEPILNILEERRERIRESLSAAETARAEAAERTQENEAIIAQARREAQEIIRQAEESARRRADELVARASEEAEARRERVLEEAEYERQQAMAELRAEVAQLSLAIARKTIGASLVDETAHRRIVDEVLAEVGT
ncbi:MAG: F0F1 ATP synthase subunit B [Chloroflexota bacterium]|nr:F0F1 ATP synthase subunit B [Chloroflexota bacterium]